MRRSWRWLALAAPLIAACAQVIGADFGGLRLDPGSGGSAGSDVAGVGGRAGMGTLDGGEAGASGGGGAAGTAGGAAGNVIKDASPDKIGAGDTGSVPDGRTDAIAADVAIADREDAKLVPPDAPVEGSVLINEIKGVGGGSDWIELFNPGQMSMVLDGYSVAQAMGSAGPPDLAGLLTFPLGTTLAGGAFLMVVAQQATIGGPTVLCQTLATSCFTVTWGVSSAGERVYLLNPADAATSVLQQVDYPASVTSGQTYARAANGAFQVAPPTPAQANGI